MTGLTGIRGRSVNGHHHAAGVHRQDAVDGSRLRQRVRRQAIDQGRVAGRHALAGAGAVHHGDDAADADRGVQIGQLAGLRRRVRVGRAVGRAVAGDLDDDVTDGDRDGGVDQSTLGGRAVGAGRVAVTRGVPVDAGVDGTERDRSRRIDQTGLGRGRARGGGHTEGRGPLAEQAHGIVIGRDGDIDVADGAELIRTDRRGRAAAVGVGRHPGRDRTGIDRYIGVGHRARLGRGVGTRGGALARQRGAGDRIAQRGDGQGDGDGQTRCGGRTG